MSGDICVLSRHFRSDTPAMYRMPAIRHAAVLPRRHFLARRASQGRYYVTPRRYLLALFSASLTILIFTRDVHLLLAAFRHFHSDYAKIFGLAFSDSQKLVTVLNISTYYATAAGLS